MRMKRLSGSDLKLYILIHFIKPRKYFIYINKIGFCDNIFSICGSSNELNNYAIRQKRDLIDGTGTYYIYVIDIHEYFFVIFPYLQVFL